MTNGSGKGRMHWAVSNDSDGTPGVAGEGEMPSVLCLFNIKGSQGPGPAVLRDKDIGTHTLRTYTAAPS